MFCWTEHLQAPKISTYAAVSVEHKLYAFGQFCDDARRRRRTDVNVFNTLSLRWVKIVTTGGLSFVGHERLGLAEYKHLGLAEYTPVLMEDIVYILGGCSSRKGCHNVLYAFDVDTHRWFIPTISGTVPQRRIYHSACVLGKVMFIYGGFINPYTLTKDIYKLDTSTMVWSLINTKGTHPHASFGHSATIVGTKMFVFGGWGARGGGFCDTSVFDTETNCWLTMPSSAQLLRARWCHSAFAYNGELYIFGVYRAGYQLEDFNDLWKLNPETFSWTKVELKGKRPDRMYDMSCCMVGDRAFLFGGDDPPAPSNLCILDFRPSLKTLCKLAVIQYDLQQSGLPHNIRWELAAMTTNMLE